MTPSTGRRQSDRIVTVSTGGPAATGPPAGPPVQGRHTATTPVNAPPASDPTALLRDLTAPPTIFPLGDQPKVPVDELVTAIGALLSSVVGRSDPQERRAAESSALVDALVTLGLPSVSEVVRRQQRIGTMVVSVETDMRRVLAKLQARLKIAKAGSTVLKKTDRLKLSVADIHDSFEDALLEVNRLASRFYRPDEELYSFQNFLKARPPCVTDPQRSRRRGR